MKPEVKAFFDQRTSTLTFVVWDANTRDAVVIDPVLDYEPQGAYTFTESVDRVSDFIKEQRLKLHYSLETHAHADHLSGSQVLKHRFEARVAIGANIGVVQETFKPLFDLSSGFATDGSQFDELVREGPGAVRRQPAHRGLQYTGAHAGVRQLQDRRCPVHWGRAVHA